MINKTIFILFSIFFSLSAAASDTIITLDYPNWEIAYNCEKRGYESFHYVTVPDIGQNDRYKPFAQESRLPKRCQQKTTRSYRLKHVKGGTYDRGHGVHQNIWDHDMDLMMLSNRMSNVVPQSSQLNQRGVWRQTEILTECYRDLGVVEVWGGNIWGNDSSNDYFLESHGVVTPDFLWKVIKFPNGEVNAWLMPNDDTPKGYMMDTYLVSPKKLQNMTGINFSIDRRQLSELDSHSVPKPRKCSIS